METNKTILMREVVAINERKIVGVVMGMRVDCDSRVVSHFVVGDFEQGVSRLLPYREIRAVGDSFVTINKEAALMPPEGRSSKDLFENGCKLVDVEVFSGDGDRVGAVGGFKFDSKNGEITSITLNDGIEYLAPNILFFSPKFVFVDAVITEDTKSAPQESETKEEPKVEEPETKEEPEVEEEQEQEEEVIVEEAEEDFSQAIAEDPLHELLIGKKVTEQVKSEDGEFLVEEGSIITDEIFAQAAKHDALLLLTLSIGI